MTDPHVITIDGCPNCYFVESDNGRPVQCWHPGVIKREWSLNVIEPQKPPPDWCLLRSAPVLVQLRVTTP